MYLCSPWRSGTLKTSWDHHILLFFVAFALCRTWPFLVAKPWNGNSAQVLIARFLLQGSIERFSHGEVSLARFLMARLLLQSFLQGFLSEFWSGSKHSDRIVPKSRSCKIERVLWGFAIALRLPFLVLPPALLSPSPPLHSLCLPTPPLHRGSPEGSAA